MEINKQKITVFTVQLTDNDYLKQPTCKLCLDSWKFLKQRIESDGHQCEIKIYMPEDEEVKNFLKIYPLTQKCLEINRLELLSDAFRMYILSKYPYHLWLDSDRYIFPSVVFTDYDKPYLIHIFHTIYNANDTKTFERFWNYYLNELKDPMNDQMVFTQLNVPEEFTFKKPIRHSHHLYKFMRIQQPQRFFYIDNKETFDYVANNLQEIIKLMLEQTANQERYITFIANLYYEDLLRLIKSTHVFNNFKKTDNLMKLDEEPEDLVKYIKEHPLNITNYIKEKIK